jgi:hypothetical protein
MVSIALHLLFAALSPKYVVFANSDRVPETVEVSQTKIKGSKTGKEDYEKSYVSGVAWKRRAAQWHEKSGGLNLIWPAYSARRRWKRRRRPGQKRPGIIRL